MKSANIVPIEYLDQIEDHTYFMALAHLVLESNEYAAFYKRHAEMGHTVILDNGVFELGSPLSFDNLYSAVEITGASIVVAPDYMHEPERTLYETRNFKHVAEELKGFYPDIQFMGVPHGFTPSQHYQNASDLITTGYLDILGICKAPERQGFRAAFVDWTEQQGLKAHALGVLLNPIQEVLLLKGSKAYASGSLTGIDSSIAFVLGHYGRTLLEWSPRPGSIDFGTTKEGSLVEWTQRQLKAFQWLVESDCSSWEEIEAEYANGRF